MKRTQIYLTDKEEEGILEIIKKNGGGTKAEHIRRAVDKYLNEYKSPPLGYFRDKNGFLRDSMEIEGFI